MAYDIVICALNMITREFCRARDKGYVDAINAPYHSDLRGYVLWATCVVRSFCQRLGVLDALELFRQALDWAATESTQVFGRISGEEEDLCPMCQENIGASKYGIFVCGHIVHRDCCSTWENHEHVWAPNCLPRFPVCRVEFRGFVWICE
jgi:hypothetical protein